MNLNLEILAENNLKKLLGPDWKERWMFWKYRTTEELVNVNIKNELDNILKQTGVDYPQFYFII